MVDIRMRVIRIMWSNNHSIRHAEKHSRPPLFVTKVIMSSGRRRRGSGITLTTYKYYFDCICMLHVLHRRLSQEPKTRLKNKDKENNQ